MEFSISTHNGHQVARQHNLRNLKVTAKEEHIDKNGIHKTWLDIRPEEAYKKIFGKALQAYNEEQKAKGHPERQIENYYKKVLNDKKKHAVYEMIVSIGSYENHPDADISMAILNEFCQSWRDRNPNLIMVGCYFHADEAGAPHVHIDYIPVANNLSRGMKRQNALTKALTQMGYETHGIHDTAQIQWEHAQNKELERICVSHGLSIKHPHRDKQKHMDMKEFRQLKRIEELEQQNRELITKINSLIDYHNQLNLEISELENGAIELANNIVNEHSIDRDELIH